MHGVYKYEVDGEVIYIGKTDSDFASRIACHGREPAFAPYLPNAKIFVQKLKDAREADFMETLLINQYKPILNKAKKDVTDIPISAIMDWDLWEKYRKKKSKKITFSTYGDEELVKILDEDAAERGVSRSYLVNQILNEIYKSKRK